MIKRIVEVVFRILAGTTGFLLFLLLILHLPPLQEMITRKAVQNIDENLSGSFDVDKIKISFFNRVKVENIRLGNHADDTIVFASEITARIRLSELPQHIIHLRHFTLKGIEVNLLKTEDDTVFNIVSAIDNKTGPEKKFNERGKSPPVFILDLVVLKDIDVDIVQDSSGNNPSESGPVPVSVSLTRGLRAKNVNLRICNNLNKNELSFRHANFSIDPDSLNLPQKSIHLNRIELTGTDVLLRKGEPARTSTSQTGDRESGEPQTEFSWNISLNELSLKNNSFAVIRRAPLLLKEIYSEISGIAMENSHYKARIKSMRFIANDQIELENFQLLTEIDNHSALFENIVLETPASMLALDAEFKYPDFHEVMTNPGNLELSVDFHAMVGSGDLENLSGNRSWLKKYPDVETEGKLRGKLSEIRLETLLLDAGSALHLAISGEMNHLTDIGRTYGNLQMESLVMAKEEAMQYISGTLFPETISIPDELSIRGSIEGNRSNLQSYLNLNTSLGMLKARLDLKTDSIPGKEILTGEFNLLGFDLGSLLNMQDTLGELTMDGRVEGWVSGFRNPEFLGEIEIVQAEILDYNYRDIRADLQYKKESIESRVRLTDKNLSLALEGRFLHTDTIPEINLLVNLGHANLGALNLSNDSSVIGGDFDVNFRGNKWNTLQGDGSADSIYYHSDLQSYLVESIVVQMKQHTDSSVYVIEARNIASGDSILAHNFDLLASIKGNRAKFRYELLANLPGYDTTQKRFEGKGNILYSNEFPSKFELAVGKTGFKVKAGGKFSGEKEDRRVDGSITTDSVDLEFIRPFVSQQVDQLRGFVTGEFSVSGPLKNPVLGGTLTLNDVLIRPSALNTDFSIKNETIEVNTSLFRIRGLTITDQTGNEAVLDGQMNLGKASGSNLDLKLDAENFQLLNKSAASANLYYGNVAADVQGNITGNFQDPGISLNTAFTRESDFTFIVPRKTSTARNQEGIIVFVDRNEPENSTRTNETLQDSLFVQRLNNMELTSQLNLSDQMTFTLVTDPATNENLQIAGNGDLVFKLNKNGSMSLAGRYEIERGRYKLRLYDLIDREFILEKGSTLSWTGDLLKARADITAVYELRASVADLVQDRMIEMNQEDMKQVNQRIKIKVKMNLSGNLLTPDIDFDIEIDERYTGSPIEAAISNLNHNESELNKQVFSLLIFNRFSGDILGDNPSMAYGFKNTAKRNLSDLLSQQLNRFADHYIKGFDLSFDIDSYQKERDGQNPSATRTDLGVDLSKDLFNDRLTIQVGGGVAVEENYSENEGSLSSGDLVGDFMVEYRLSRDGTYRLQAFNRTEYEDEIDGDVSKTGISIIFSKDFVFLNKLFKRRKKKKSEKK